MKISGFPLLIILFLLPGCRGDTENDPFKHATWIGEREVDPIPDSLMYGDHPAPLFRKEFPVNKGAG